MILAIVLFFQIATENLPRTVPVPKRVETPVEHWSCGSKFSAYEVNGITQCKIVSPSESRLMAGGYDENTQELISWEWTKIIPKSGHLRVAYPPDFVRQPGCEVIDKTDEATNKVGFSSESKSGVTLHAPPGHELLMKCRGIINR